MTGQMVGFYLCHALQIFQDLLYQFFIGVNLAARQTACGLLQSGVRQQEQGKAHRQHQCDSPIKEQQHHDDDGRGK